MKVDMMMVEVSTEEDVPTIQDTDILFPFSWAYRPVTSCGIATTAPRSRPLIVLVVFSSTPISKVGWVGKPDWVISPFRTISVFRQFEKWHTRVSKERISGCDTMDVTLDSTGFSKNLLSQFLSHFKYKTATIYQLNHQIY